MATSKKELFTKELQECSDIFKALGHPARLTILKYLADSKGCITGELSDELPLSRSTVNQHLAELSDLGIIISHKEGTKTYYCLNDKKIKKFSKISKGFWKSVKLQDECECKKK